LSLAGNTISITGGNSIVLSDNIATNEIQDLSLSGNTLSLSSDATPVNLTPYLDNTTIRIFPSATTRSLLQTQLRCVEQH